MKPSLRRLKSGFPRLVLPALLFAAPGVSAADNNAVIEAWLASQTNLTTWSAEFVQTRWLKALYQPLVSTGHVWFAKPNHFRWELGIPAQTIAIRDDQQLRVIYPRLKRVEQYSLDPAKPGPMSEALGLLDAGFPRDRADFDARFRVLAVHATNDAWRIELEPASAAARRLLSAVRVTVAATDLSLRASEMQFADGSRMRSEFRNVALNPSFPPDLFRPGVPPEFTLTQPLSP